MQLILGPGANVNGRRRGQAPWLGEGQGRGEEGRLHVSGVRACQDVPQLSEEEGQVDCGLWGKSKPLGMQGLRAWSAGLHVSLWWVS